MLQAAAQELSDLPSQQQLEKVRQQSHLTVVLLKGGPRESFIQVSRTSGASAAASLLLFAMLRSLMEWSLKRRQEDYRKLAGVAD